MTSPADQAAGLLPCPFCGYPKPYLDLSSGDFVPRCSGVCCWVTLGAYATEEEAIAAWNKRASAAASPATATAPSNEDLTVTASMTSSNPADLAAVMDVATAAARKTWGRQAIYSWDYEPFRAQPDEAIPRCCNCETPKVLRAGQGWSQCENPACIAYQEPQASVSYRIPGAVECPGCGKYHVTGHEDSCACDHCAVEPPAAPSAPVDDLFCEGDNSDIPSLSAPAPAGALTDERQYSNLRLNTARADLLRWLERIHPDDVPVNLFNPMSYEDGPDSDLHVEAGVLRALLLASAGERSAP